MKNKGLIITSIILLSILVIFLIMFLVTAITGKGSFVGMLGVEKDSGKVIFDDNFGLEGINKIQILSKTGDIIFEENKDENIRVVAYGKNDGDIKVELNGDQLKIDYTKYSKSWFGFNHKTDIIVYIPTNYTNTIDIDSDYGDCSFCDLEEATIKIKADAGDIHIGKVKNVDLDSDYGDIEIDSVLHKLKVISDYGDIHVKELGINENSSIEADYGDIDIGKTNDIYIDAKVDLGSCNINRNDRKSEIILKIKSDFGDINVNN